MEAASPTRLAWRQSLGAGLLLGLALGCAWLARSTPHLYPRLLLLVAAALLALLGLGLMLAVSDERGWTAAWQSRWNYTFPAAGVPFFSALIVLTVAAVTSGNNLLYLIVSGLLAVLVISGLVSALNLSGLDLGFQLPAEVFAGQAAPVRLRLTNAKSLWPAYSLTVGALTRAPHAGAPEESALRPVYFPYLPRRAGAAAESELLVARRGRYRAASFVVSTRFPFGLVQKRRRFRAGAREPELLVYPAPVEDVEAPLRRLRAGAELVQMRRGEGQDLYLLRPHQPGDSARQVHWKATARAGALMVRESSGTDGVRVRLRLELAPGLDADAAEAALSLCAGWMLALDRTDLWLEFAAAHPIAPGGAGLFLAAAPAPRHRRAVLDYLALVDLALPPAPRPHGTPGLPEILISGPAL